MRRIEKIRGYDMETVLNSTFCYKLLNEHPKMGHQPYYGSTSGAKVQHNSEKTKTFVCFNSSVSTVTTQFTTLAPASETENSRFVI